MGPQTGCVKWLALVSKERDKGGNTHRYNIFRVISLCFLLLTSSFFNTYTLVNPMNDS